jgi:hypothetical protein
MIQEKDMWLKQMAAKVARNCYTDQIRYLDKLAEEGATESEMLRGLERKFFLNRKDATNTILSWEELQ